MTTPQFALDLSMVTGTKRLESDRMALLHSIQQKGTLTEAAKDIGISYKTACAWLDALNNAADEPLLTASHGGNSRGGTVLTELGVAYLERYERMVNLHARMQSELETAGELSGFLQRLRLRTSARNHLHGVVLDISGGKVQCLVTLQLSANITIQAKVSREAVYEMDLTIGTRIAAVFKAASVHLESNLETCSPLPPNCWRGKVIRVHADLESVDVTLDLDGQHTVSALVDRERWDAIQSESPDQATAIISPAHVLLIRMD